MLVHLMSWGSVACVMLATLVTTTGLWPVSESIHCPLDTAIQYVLPVFIGPIWDCILMNTSGHLTSFCQYVCHLTFLQISWNNTLAAMIMIYSSICVNATLGNEEVIVSIVKIGDNHSYLCCFIVEFSCLLYLLLLQ